MMKVVQVVAGISVAASMASCAQKPAAISGDEALGPGSVATVNGERIPESVFRVYVLSTLRKNADDLSPEERKTVVEDLTGVYLLAGEAKKQGLLGERALAAQLELTRRQLEARAMATRYLDEHAPTEDELKALYEQNVSRLSGQQFKARNIVLATKEEADAVIGQLQQGKSFADLAKQHANGPTGPNGGDLGWIGAGSMPQPIIDAIASLTAGQFSTEPVQTDFGYHVLLLEETRNQPPPSLDDIRNDLVQAVQRDKLQQHIRDLIAGAKVDEEQ